MGGDRRGRREDGEVGAAQLRDRSEHADGHREVTGDLPEPAPVRAQRKQFPGTGHRHGERVEPPRILRHDPQFAGVFSLIANDHPVRGQLTQPGKPLAVEYWARLARDRPADQGAGRAQRLLDENADRIHG